MSFNHCSHPRAMPHVGVDHWSDAGTVTGLDIEDDLDPQDGASEAPPGSMFRGGYPGPAMNADWHARSGHDAQRFRQGHMPGPATPTAPPRSTPQGMPSRHGFGVPLAPSPASYQPPGAFMPHPMAGFAGPSPGNGISGGSAWCGLGSMVGNGLAGIGRMVGKGLAFGGGLLAARAANAFFGSPWGNAFNGPFGGPFGGPFAASFCGPFSAGFGGIFQPPFAGPIGSPFFAFNPFGFDGPPSWQWNDWNRWCPW